MGVSLERVQFKFASIVGELCNEPDVLSQFAVWLDLRLAEYKLKGAISLDCSGEEPEASWMKGLKKCKKCAIDRQTNRHGSMLPRRHVPDDKPYVSDEKAFVSDEKAYVSDEKPYSSMSPGTNSPVFTLIKTEPQEVVPLELHENSVTTCSVSRKRSNSDGQWLQNSGTSSSKRQYLSSRSTSNTNQSLLSVIGDVHDVTPTSHPESSNQTEDVVLSSEQFLLESNNGGTNRQSTSVDPNSSWSNQQGTSLDSSLNATKGDMKRGAATTNPPMSRDSLRSKYKTRDVRPAFQSYDTDGNSQPKKVMNNVRKSKISPVRLAVIPQQSVISMVAAVGTFERWLWGTYPDDRRAITEINPDELDNLLVEFYQTICTPAGETYTANSFSMLRCYLARYLKETNYKESPISKYYSRSSEAYRKRFKEISILKPNKL